MKYQHTFNTLTPQVIMHKNSFLFYCKRIINFKPVKINTICGTLTYNTHNKFDLNRTNCLDTLNNLTTQTIMYKNYFLYSSKKNYKSITEINRVHLIVSCNIIPNLSSIECTIQVQSCSHTHTHCRKNSINELRRPQNI